MRRGSPGRLTSAARAPAIPSTAERHDQPVTTCDHPVARKASMRQHHRDLTSVAPRRWPTRSSPIVGFEHFATLRLDAAIRLRIALRAMRLAGSYHLQVAATEDDDRSAWDAFLVKAPRAPYQQSSLWAKVKAGQGWRSARMTVTRDGSIHAGAQLLYRAIPLAGAVGFVARRPHPSHPTIRRWPRPPPRVCSGSRPPAT